jgi:hypothetical protein
MGENSLQALVDRVDMDTAYTALLTLTITFSITFLAAVPLGIYGWHLYHTKDDEEEDALVDEPVSPKRRIIAWFRSSITFLVGLFLLTVFASEARFLSDLDYYGPMGVRFYEISPQESWAASGLSRHRVLELDVILELEWSQGNNETKKGCISTATYEPCTIVIACTTKGCSDEDFQNGTAKANNCIQEALQKSTNYRINFMDDDDELYPFDTPTGKELPSLSYHGDSETCHVQPQFSSIARIERVGYSGAILTLIGIFLVLTFCVILGGRELIPEYDGDTFCGSVASLDDSTSNTTDLDEDEVNL